MNVTTINERNTKKRSVHAAADVLELNGNVELADELRRGSIMQVSEPPTNNQGTVDEIADRNNDIKREYIVNIIKMQRQMVLVTVGDEEALVERSVALRALNLLQA